MIILENPNGEATAVVRVEVSKTEHMIVTGIDPSEIKPYTDENGNSKFYVEMKVPVSLKKAYEGDENTQKKRVARMNRCLVPGKHKAWIRCPECNKCSECENFCNKKAGIISMEKYIEDGCPDMSDHKTPEDEVMYFDMLDSLVSVAAEKRARLGQEVKLLESGYEKEELPAIIGISETTVYEDLKIIADLLYDIAGVRR